MLSCVLPSVPHCPSFSLACYLSHLLGIPLFTLLGTPTSLSPAIPSPPPLLDALYTSLMCFASHLHVLCLSPSHPCPVSYAFSVLSQKFATGPCQLRRGARTQSVELQELIFIHAHEVSQPNWGTLNVVLCRVLIPLLMLLSCYSSLSLSLSLCLAIHLSPLTLPSNFFLSCFLTLSQMLPFLVHFPHLSCLGCHHLSCLYVPHLFCVQAFPSSHMRASQLSCTCSPSSHMLTSFPWASPFSCLTPPCTSSPAHLSAPLQACFPYLMPPHVLSSLPVSSLTLPPS